MRYLLRAVVVGIDEYSDPRSHGIAKLACAKNDATEIEKVLKSSFRLEGTDHILFTNKDATQREVRDALDDRFSKKSLGRNTIALFYFAGHGIIGENGKVYLCCYNTDFSNAEHGGIRLNDVYDWLTSCSAECAIAIIDACFSGGLTTRILDHVSAAEHARRAIEQIKSRDGKNVAIFAACRSDQYAREDKDLGHGMFTYGILCGWRDGYARDKDDGIVYLSGLNDYLLKGFEGESQKPKISLNSNSRIALTLPNPLPPVVIKPPIPISSEQRPRGTIDSPSNQVPPLHLQNKTSKDQFMRPNPPHESLLKYELPGSSSDSYHTPGDFHVPGPIAYDPSAQRRKQRIMLVCLLLTLILLILIFILYRFTIHHSF